jgi:hypothetical protein
MVEIPDPLKTELKKIAPKPMAFTNEMVLRLECVKQAVILEKTAGREGIVATAKALYAYVEKGE